MIQTLYQRKEAMLISHRKRGGKRFRSNMEQAPKRCRRKPEATNLSHMYRSSRMKLDSTPHFLISRRLTNTRVLSKRKTSKCFENVWKPKDWDIWRQPTS